MSDFPLQRLLESLLDLLERNQVEYMLMGGVAVRYWGIPRPTFDLDLTVSLDQDDARQLAELLHNEGFSVPAPFREGFQDELSGMHLMNPAFDRAYLETWAEQIGVSELLQQMLSE